ncbi:MAG: hypothetical protein PWQ57_1729 [Desulfovibrionales bacterium]|nr:hypothetical protein [Desulfovibrionales bacterium]
MGWLAQGLAWVIDLLMDIVYYFIEFAFNIPSSLEWAWGKFCSFANIILAAAIVVLAVMTTLRIKQDSYSVKKMLPSILISLVMVNLSWVIGLFVMDLG